MSEVTQVANLSTAALERLAPKRHGHPQELRSTNIAQRCTNGTANRPEPKEGELFIQGGLTFSHNEMANYLGISKCLDKNGKPDTECH